MRKNMIRVITAAAAAAVMFAVPVCGDMSTDTGAVDAFEEKEIRAVFVIPEMEYIFGENNGEFPCQRVKLMTGEQETDLPEGYELKYHIKGEETGAFVNENTGEVCISDYELFSGFLEKNNGEAPVGITAELTGTEGKISEAEYIINARYADISEAETVLEGKKGKNEWFISEVKVKTTDENLLISKSCIPETFSGETVFTDSDEAEAYFRDKKTGGISPKIKIPGLKTDMTKPVLEADVDEPYFRKGDNAYYNNYPTVRLRIKEKNFDPESTTITMIRNDEETGIVEAAWQKTEEGADADVRLENDGCFSIKTDCEDAAGNIMDTYVSENLIVDTAPPEIYADFSNRDEVIVSVFEENFDEELLNIELYAWDKYNEPLETEGRAVISKLSTQENTYAYRIRFIADARYGFNVSCTDLSGNTVFYEGKNIIADNTPPEVLKAEYSKCISQEEGIGYYSGVFTVRAEVTDNMSGVEGVVFGIEKENGKVFERRVSGDDLRYDMNGNAAAVITVPDAEISQDGQFKGRVYIYAEDKTGNISAVYRDDRISVVDSISPKINVSSSAPVSIFRDEIFFNKPVTVMIEVDEANFNEKDLKLKVTKNGKEMGVSPVWKRSQSGGYLGSFELDEDGRYMISASYTDRSGNSSGTFTSGVMVLDTEIEGAKLKISGRPADGQSVNGEAVLSFIFYDENASSCSASLKRISKTGTMTDVSEILREGMTYSENMISCSTELPDKSKENDGIYFLEAVLCDRAGNSFTEKAVFTINRFGSEFEILSGLKAIMKMPMSCVKSVEEDIVIREVNPDLITESSIILEHNGRPADNAEYEVVRADMGTGESWKKYNYVFDRGNFEKDGIYRISLISKDKAGNSSDLEAKTEETVFRVDGTPPELNILRGLQDDEYAEKNSVEFSVFDAGGLAEVTASINGKTVLKENDFSKDMNFCTGTFEIPQESGKQHVRITARDIAGNVLDTDEKDHSGVFDIYTNISVSETLPANEELYKGSTDIISADIKPEKTQNSTAEPAFILCVIAAGAVFAIILYYVCIKKKKNSV